MNYKHVVRLGVALAFAFPAVAQEPAKPTIAIVRELPSDPPLKAASCSSSTSGYLEKNGAVLLTDAEIGTAVAKALKEGYVVTLFPEGKRGIFVNFECPHPSSEKPPKVP